MQLGTLYTEDNRSPEFGSRVEVFNQFRGAAGCVCRIILTNEVVRVVISELFEEAQRRAAKGEFTERLIEGWVWQDKHLKPIVKPVETPEHSSSRTFWGFLKEWFNA